MIIFLAVLAVLCLVKIRISIKLDEDFLSVVHTTAIKGVFVAMVFFAHVQQYITLHESLGDKLFDFALTIFGQNIVIAFLLYSGYGIGEAMKKKGQSYVRQIPRKRILVTWLHFAIAVVIFWGVNAVWTRDPYSVGQYALSLIGLQSIGNSTWYIFAILVCWVGTYFAFRYLQKPGMAIGAVTAFLVVYIAVISRVKPEHCWYDTIFCYPVGLCLSYYKEPILRVLRKKLLTAMLLALFCTWVLLRLFVEMNMVLLQVQSLLFAAFLVVLTSRVHVENGVLKWLGKHTFSIYILQRIPMIILAHYGINEFNSILYTAVCMIATGAIAVGFDWCMGRLDRRILSIGAMR